MLPDYLRAAVSEMETMTSNNKEYVSVHLGLTAS